MSVTSICRPLVIAFLSFCGTFLSGSQAPEMFSIYNKDTQELLKKIASLPPELQKHIAFYFAKAHNRAFLPLYSLPLAEPMQELAIPAEAIETDSIRYAQFTPTGSHVLSAGLGNAVCLWDKNAIKGDPTMLNREKDIASSTPPIDLAYVITASNNNALYATQHGGKDIVLWSLEKKKLLNVLSHEGDIWWAHFTSKGDRLIVGTSIGLVLWYLDKVPYGKKIPGLYVEGALNADDTKLALKIQNPQKGDRIEVWNLNTLVSNEEKEQKLLVGFDVLKKGHSPLYSLFFDSLDALLVVRLTAKEWGSNFDKPGYITFIRENRELGTFEVLFREEVEHVPRYAAYSKKDNLLLIAGPTLKPQLWDLTAKKCLAVIDSDETKITSIALNTYEECLLAIAGFEAHSNTKPTPTIKLWHMPQLPPSTIMQKLTIEKVLFFCLLDFLRSENKERNLRLIQYKDELKKELQRIFKTLDDEEKEYVRLLYFSDPAS